MDRPLHQEEESATAELSPADVKGRALQWACDVTDGFA